MNTRPLLLFLVGFLLFLSSSSSFSFLSSAPLPLPNLPFTGVPSNDTKVLALTFDDGPDVEGNTMSILGSLYRLKVPATFFVNTNNRMNVQYNTNAQEQIRAIVNSGQTLGSHTHEHKNLSHLTRAQIQEQITLEQTIIDQVVPGGYKLVIGRTPYGEGFVNAVPSQPVNDITSVFNEYMIHIGWGIDSGDFHCQTKECVLSNMEQQLNQGKSGVVYMHSTLKHTAEAVEDIIKMANNLGYRFVRVDDLLISLYGVDSKAIYNSYRVQGQAIPEGVYPVPEFDPTGLKAPPTVNQQNTGAAGMLTPSLVMVLVLALVFLMF